MNPEVLSHEVLGGGKAPEGALAERDLDQLDRAGAAVRTASAAAGAGAGAHDRGVRTRT